MRVKFVCIGVIFVSRVVANLIVVQLTHCLVLQRLRFASDIGLRYYQYYSIMLISY